MLIKVLNLQILLLIVTSISSTSSTYTNNVHKSHNCGISSEHEIRPRSNQCSNIDIQTLYKKCTSKQRIKNMNNDKNTPYNSPIQQDFQKYTNNKRKVTHCHSNYHSHYHSHCNSNPQSYLQSNLQLRGGASSDWSSSYTDSWSGDSNVPSQGGGWDNDYSDSRDSPYSSRSRSPPPRSGISAPNIPHLSGFANRQLGFLLLTFGSVLTLLGIALFFEKNLLRFGNLLFIAGIPMVIGPGRTASYFLQPKKSRATGCLGMGIVMVLAGRPMIGMGMEAFGVLNLFGNLFPIVGIMVKRLPAMFGVGSGGGMGGGGGGSRRGRDEEEQYYEGGYGSEGGGGEQS